MGHYDDQRDRADRENRDKTSLAAQLEANKQKTRVLASSSFLLIGVCGACARGVYAIPNWGCRQLGCPHRP